MSLLQLLTTGKALEGVHDSSHRYQMTNQRLLPRFGSRRNPFAASKAAASGATEPARAPEIPPVVKPPAKSVFSGGAVRQPEVGWLARWVTYAKSKIQDRFRKPGNAPARPVAPVSQPAPRQGELLLEGVKVVRNDLSETDLEVVKTAPVPAPVPAPGGVAEANSAPKSAAPRRAWDRMCSRLVGAGKN